MLTPEKVKELLRGLTLAQYSRAFNAGANSYRRFPNDDLDKRLDRYMAVGRKTYAHEQAWLDGNTWCDETPLRALVIRAEQED